MRGDCFETLQNFVFGAHFICFWLYRGNKLQNKTSRGGTSIASHPVEVNDTEKTTKDISELYIDITTNEPLPDEEMVSTKNSSFVYGFNKNRLFYSPDESLFIGLPGNKPLEQTHSFKLSMEKNQKQKILRTSEASGLLSERRVELPGSEKGYNEIGVILHFKDGSVNNIGEANWMNHSWPC